MRTLDHSLHVWIAENLIANCDPEALITTLVGLEIPVSEARAAVEGASSNPYFMVASDLNTKLKKRDALLNTLDHYARMDPQYLTITPQELPPYADFIRDHYSKNRPGLFKNAVNHWRAMQWTPRNLVDKIGADTVIEIQQGRDTTKEYEVESVSLKRNIRFGDFIDKVESADTNDFYLTANNLAMANGPFKSLAADIGTLGDGYLDAAQMDQRMFLWVGPKGTVTPLHHDKSNNIFIQVYGRKRFRLIPSIEVPYMYNHLGVFTKIDLFAPDDAQFPLYRNVGMIDITVEAGDFLFIPIGWWHHVTAETASISLSFTNLPVANHFFDYPSVG